MLKAEFNCVATFEQPYCVWPVEDAGQQAFIGDLTAQPRNIQSFYVGLISESCLKRLAEGTGGFVNLGQEMPLFS